MNVLFKLATILGLPFLLILIHVVSCGVLAWFVGLFFEKDILGILSQLNIVGYSMFEIGLFLGFVSGFFKRLISFDLKDIFK